MTRQARFGTADDVGNDGQPWVGHHIAPHHGAALYGGVFTPETLRASGLALGTGSCAVNLCGNPAAIHGATTRTTPPGLLLGAWTDMIRGQDPVLGGMPLLCNIGIKGGKGPCRGVA